MFLLVLKMMFVQKNLFCTRPEKMLNWRRNFLIILCCEFELKNIIIDFMPIFFFIFWYHNHAHCTFIHCIIDLQVFFLVHYGEQKNC